MHGCRQRKRVCQVTKADVEKMNIANVVRLVWRRKLLVSAAVALAAIVSIIVSLLLPNKYLSTATVATANNTFAAQAGQLSQLSGLASLAGIDLGAGPVDQTTKYTAIMQSRQFVAHFIKKRGVLPQLFAGDEWEWQQNRWTLDPEIYDVTNQRWVRKVSFPKTSAPQEWEAYERFMEVFELEQDKKTALITVSLKLTSPHHARLWLDWMIEDFNDYVRARDIAQAQQASAFVVQELKKTEVFEVQQVLREILEQNIKSAVLANVQKSYALEVIDAPLDSTKKYEPKRTLIVLMSCFLALLLVLVYIFIAETYRVDDER